MMSVTQGGRADHNSSPVGRRRTFRCCHPLHAQLACVGTRNGVSPVTLPGDPPPTLARFPSAFTSRSPSKILEISVVGRSRTPHPLTPSIPNSVLFNTARQMLLFSRNLSRTGQTSMPFLFSKAGNCSAPWEIQHLDAEPHTDRCELCFPLRGRYSTLLDRQAQTLAPERPPHTMHASCPRG